MRQKRPITLIEVTGTRYGISRAFAIRLAKDSLVDVVPRGVLIERRRVMRAASTRYVDDPTPEGRSYKDEILSRIRQSRQNKPRLADEYVPLPFGWQG